MRVAEIYKRFAKQHAGADLSDSAAEEMYLHESAGKPLRDPMTNGYAIGKKWMDVTVAAWREDIAQMGLFVSELQGDGYPDWFLDRVGVLQARPSRSACSWFLDRDHQHADQPEG
jgi:hypothetical protein